MARQITGSVKIEFNNFPYMRQAMINEVQKAVKETGEEVINEARRIVPVRTGRLRASLRVGKVEKQLGTDPAYFAVNLSSDAPYWGYVEYGTRHMAARPYIRPAVEWGKYYLSERVEGAIQRATISRRFERPWEEGGE